MLTVRSTAVGARASAAAARLRARPAKRVCVRVRATSNLDTEDLQAKLQDSFESTTTKIKVTWQKTEDKPVVVTLAAASLIGIIALNAVADALNALPLVGGALEVVGICATSWFTYRYLVFGPDRQELKQNVLDFVKKVQGK